MFLPEGQVRVHLCGQPLKVYAAMMSSPQQLCQVFRP